MQRPGQAYRHAGIGGMPEDAYMTDEDASVIQPPNEFLPGPVCQPIGSDGLGHSGNTLAPDFSRDQMLGPSRRSDRSFLGAPLSLRTMSTSMSMPEIYQTRSGTDSPSNQLHHMPTPPFPTLRHGSLEEPTSSPRTERLPSFRQLSKIADGGTESTEPRATSSYPALPSHPPTMISQSPAKNLPYFSASQQSSPTASFTMLSHPSPTGARPDPPEMFAMPHSPANYPMPDPNNRYVHRRRSFGAVKAPPFQHSITSSSNETTLSHQSSADSYSTANTTPTEGTGLEGSNKPGAPLPMGLQQSPPATGIFQCDYPGCNAPPFQTQYLLNSHANVHSSNRPHYCPVKGCPRGEGGKGFKRKNEMIRHGLVHDSPGYICPFCPLREHRYPRPDNLQRHVRVHHVDKDKDDPLLREVLSQRPEGGSRGRRRRTGP